MATRNPYADYTLAEMVEMERTYRQLIGKYVAELRPARSPEPTERRRVAAAYLARYHRELGKVHQAMIAATD